jgi:hypothetical protein
MSTTGSPAASFAVTEASYGALIGSTPTAERNPAASLNSRAPLPDPTSRRVSVSRGSGE